MYKLLLPEIEKVLKAGGYFLQMSGNSYRLYTKLGKPVGSFNLARFNSLVMRLGDQLKQRSNEQWHFEKRERY